MLNMTTILEEDLGYLYRKIVRGKDKNEKFLHQKDFCVNVKKQNYNMLHEDVQQSAPHYNVISNDVWYQVSRYVEPEDVQTFAMICKATAAIVRSKSFWRHMFHKYCLKFSSGIWILQLPAHLQLDSISDFSPQLFRSCVIEALFYCYTPLANRLNCYTLDLLLGKDYISAWHKRWENCMWIMCYQFRQHKCLQRNDTIAKKNVNRTKTEFVNDWELLAVDDDANDDCTEIDDYCSGSVEGVNPYDGVCLLIIFGNRFIPFPAQLTSSYGEESSFLRLSATRRPLTSDLREYNLELDFLDTINMTITTVKYPAVKHKILPWWHPDFKKYVKYDSCDKFS